MDLSRHYYPIAFIEHTIDAMSSNKLNVLHLHLTDDASFPVEFTSQPELSRKGAFGSDYVYAKEDLEELARYAETRRANCPGDRHAGHSSSWRVGDADIVVSGFEGCSPAPFTHGDVLDPTNPRTFEVISNLVKELTTEIFPNTTLVHLGGDEVPVSCWENSPQISRFMRENGFDDPSELVGYFLRRAADHVSNASTIMYWEEAFANDNGSSIPKNAIVHVWKKDSQVAAAAVASGRRVVLSSGWYLNHGPSNYGDGLWGDFYDNDPSTYSDSALLIGGVPAITGPSASMRTRSTFGREPQRRRKYCGAREISHARVPQRLASTRPSQVSSDS